MVILADWTLIIFSSIILVASYRRIVFKQNAAIGNYIILLLYVFCVVPIILNYIFGIPHYDTIYWYKPFINVMKNEKVTYIYDAYILITILCIFFFNVMHSPNISLKENNSLTSIYQNNKTIFYINIFLPVIFIILTGTLKNYSTYNLSSKRGIDSPYSFLMTPLLLISVSTYFSRVFKGKFTFAKFLYSLIYFAAIVWISGKRFMLANIILLFIFYITNLNLKEKSRGKMFIALPILAIVLLVFSAFYLAVVRPMKKTSVDSIYDMLRVDFGRDDVIKYVIQKEVIDNERILDYRGETFIGLLGSFIPRAIWHSKPFPHYMYLTASILHLPLDELPAGTTPSILEMTICNFGILGFPAGVVLLVLLCNLIDKIKDVDSKAICLILMTVLLTQSMDVYLIYIVYLIAMKLFMKAFKNKKVKIVWGKND